MTFWDYIFNPGTFFLGLVALVWGSVFFLSHRRKLEMQVFAEKNSMTFLDHELPRDFPPAVLDAISKWSRPLRCVSGFRNNERFVCFDYKIFWRRYRSRGTAFAVPESDVSGLSTMLRNCVVYRDAEWTVVAMTAGPRGKAMSAVLETWDDVYEMARNHREFASPRTEAVLSGSALKIPPRHEKLQN